MHIHTLTQERAELDGIQNEMRCNANTGRTILSLLLILTGLFHLFILVLFRLGISSDPFPCTCLGSLLSRSISDPDFDIQPFLE